MGITPKLLFLLTKKIIENIYIDMFKQGKISPDIQDDYNLFCTTLDHVFDQDNMKFHIDKVYSLLPGNKFAKLYIEYIEKNKIKPIL